MRLCTYPRLVLVLHQDYGVDLTKRSTGLCLIRRVNMWYRRWQTKPRRKNSNAARYHTHLGPTRVADAVFVKEMK
jgi:cytochrome c biogenesis protein ResB